MLLTFTTFANADEGKYAMVQDSKSLSVWVLNTENGDIKRCNYSSTGVWCTRWRKNDEDRFYED